MILHPTYNIESIMLHRTCNVTLMVSLNCAPCVNWEVLYEWVLIAGRYVYNLASHCLASVLDTLRVPVGYAASTCWLHCVYLLVTLHLPVGYAASTCWLRCLYLLVTLRVPVGYTACKFWLRCTYLLVTLREPVGSLGVSVGYAACTCSLHCA